MFTDVLETTQTALSGFSLDWRGARVILFPGEQLIPEMDPLAYAEARDLKMDDVAQLVMPDRPDEWLLGIVQEKMRGLLEAFLNHHELGLDGRPGDTPAASLLGEVWQLGPYIEALHRRGFDLRAIAAAIEVSTRAQGNDYARAAADVLAAWYTQLPALAGQTKARLTPLHVDCPESLDTARYGREGSTGRDAVVEFTRFGREHLTGVYRWLFVHGSYATEDFVEGISDLDTFGVVKAEVARDADALMQARASIAPAWAPLFKADPLQHHGIMSVAEQDLAFYPQPFFPALLIDYAKTVIGDGPIAMSERDSTFMRRYVLYRVRQYFRWQSSACPNLGDAFTFKHMVNMVLLGQTLILQRDGRFTYKRDTFQRAHDMLPEAMSETLSTASRIRREALYSIDARWTRSCKETRIEDLTRFHAEVRACETRAQALETAGPLFVHRARQMIDFMIERVEGEDARHHGVPDNRERPKLVEPCKPIPLEDYKSCIEAARAAFFERVPDGRMATFGSVTAPGVSDIDLMVAMGSPEEHGPRLDSFHADLLAAHPRMKDVLVHPVSMILPLEMTGEVAKLYPIFGELDWRERSGKSHTAAIDDKASRNQQLAGLAELATMYFLRRDLAEAGGTPAERPLLLRSSGLRHSYRVLQNHDWHDKGFEQFNDQVDDHRRNLFKKTASERLAALGDLAEGTVAAQLCVFAALARLLPDIVDCGVLKDLPAGRITGIWAMDTYFVTGWTPDMAMGAMTRMKQGCQKTILVLPAEIGVLFSAYARRPGAMRTFMRTRFVDGFGADQEIVIHSDLESRLALIDRHYDFLLAGVMRDGGPPHLQFNPADPVWGSPEWRAEAKRDFARGHATVERLQHAIYRTGLLLAEIRRLMDSGKAEEAEPLARRFCELADTAEGHYLHALSLIARDKATEAIEAYDRALHLGHNAFWVRFNRAQAYLRLGQLDAAQADLDACRTNPLDPDGLKTVQTWIDQARG